MLADICLASCNRCWRFHKGASRIAGAVVVDATQGTAATEERYARILSCACRLPVNANDWLVDDIMFYVKKAGHKRKLSDIRRAVRRVIEDEQRARKTNLLMALNEPLSIEEIINASAEWDRLAEVFDEVPALSINVLKHSIWQVKQKSAGRAVVHHLMPVIFSPVQGGGKTTFVRRFLGPLHELASDPVTLSDVVDTRSGGLFRYLVLFVDDVDKPSKGQVPLLKSTVTADRLFRRMLGKSWGKNWNQESSFIGTANERVSKLIDDDTGHRRFAELQFRNGNVATGGEAGVWSVIDSLDYLLLWRSVDMFGPAPIEKQLRTLAVRQHVQMPEDIVASWARGLDLGREEFRQITQRPGIRARDLYHLFTDDTDDTISEKVFAQAMKASAAEADFPFERKNRIGGGNYYRLKPDKSLSKT